MTMMSVNTFPYLVSHLLRNDLSVYGVLDENYFVARNYETGAVLFLFCLIIVWTLDLFPELLHLKVKPCLFCSIELLEILLI